MLLTIDEAYSRITGADFTRAALITDPHQPDNPIIYATKAFYELTGYDREEVIGRNCRFLQGPNTDPQAITDIREAVLDLSPITIDILNYCKDGRPFWNRLRIRPSFDADGALEYFIGVQNPIAERDVRPFKLDRFVE